MHKTNLRRVGGSVMLAVPPVFLEQLGVAAGSSVNLTLAAGRIEITPVKRPRYALDELLAQSDFSGPRSPEDQQWLDDAPVGREVL